MLYFALITKRNKRLIFKKKKKSCNVLELKMLSFFGENGNCNDDELDTVNILTEVSMIEKYFNSFLENSDINLDNE